MSIGIHAMLQACFGSNAVIEVAYQGTFTTLSGVYGNFHLPWVTVNLCSCKAQIFGRHCKKWKGNAELFHLRNHPCCL